jgi:regulator of sirC expression with transglutaminase-like and TPR domain
MALSDDEIPLDEAALLIAAHADSNLDVAAQLERLDDLAVQIGPATTDRVCRHVFETLGLRGDDQTYDDPRNSYLDQVLNRRLGIPISLSVLLIEIGRRCGLDLEGVGMPGHFLVRDPHRPDLLIDSFAGGERLDHAACARLFHRVTGAKIELHREVLVPVGTRAIMARMLANLDHSFRRRQDRDGMRWVARLQLAIPGQPLADRVSLADRMAELGCYDDAAEILEELAQRPGTSGEAARALRVRARGLLAPFN